MLASGRRQGQMALKTPGPPPSWLRHAHPLSTRLWQNRARSPRSAPRRRCRTRRRPRGAWAARRWIHDELKASSPRLQVSYDIHVVAPQGRITCQLELRNVMALLPDAAAHLRPRSLRLHEPGRGRATPLQRATGQRHEPTGPPAGRRVRPRCRGARRERRWVGHRVRPMAHEDRFLRGRAIRRSRRRATRPSSSERRGRVSRGSTSGAWAT